MTYPRVKDIWDSDDRCGSRWDIGEYTGYTLRCTHPQHHEGLHQAPAFKSHISWSDDEAVQPREPGYRGANE